MKLLLSNEQLHFFEKNGWLEVENLVRAHEQIPGFLHMFQEAISSQKVGKKDELRKFLSRVAPLVAQLTFAKVVRYVFDFPFEGDIPVLKSTIEELSPVKGVLLGALVAANGTCIFLKTDCTIPEQLIEKFRQGSAIRGALIAFGGKNLQYLLNEKSPVGKELKAMGYVYGDMLKQSSHPVLFG